MLKILAVLQLLWCPCYSLYDVRQAWGMECNLYT